MKPRLLDLFAGAGGAAKGYQRAGFYVVGVDNRPQPNYCGDGFLQSDALNALRALLDGASVGGVLLREFVAIHASPPCQHYSELGSRYEREDHVALIPPTRELLEATGLPYVIENVSGARSELREPSTLCGSSFGLGVRRHRLFETNWSLMAPSCAHGQQVPRFDVYEHGRWFKSAVARVYGKGGGKGEAHWDEAMDIDWMTRGELAQAIPPAYTELIGHQLMQHVQQAAAA